MNRTLIPDAIQLRSIDALIFEARRQRNAYIAAVLRRLWHSLVGGTKAVPQSIGMPAGLLRP
jgi:hypothetical protein